MAHTVASGKKMRAAKDTVAVVSVAKIFAAADCENPRLAGLLSDAWHATSSEQLLFTVAAYL